MNIVSMATFKQKYIVMSKLAPTPIHPRKEKELSKITNLIIHNGSSHAEKNQNNVSREVIKK